MTDAPASPSASTTPSALDLLAPAHEWLAERIELVRSEHLALPTPCAEFDLATLLDHLATSIERFTAALGGTALEPGRVPSDATEVASRFAALRTANLAAWRQADLSTVLHIPIGEVPAGVVVQLNLAELVLHTWDVSHAIGERAEAPGPLAEAVLAFGRAFLSDELRARAFGPAVATDGASASDRMAAFYGRRA